MLHQVFRNITLKKVTLITFMLVVLLLPSEVTHAAVTRNYDDACADMEGTDWGNAAPHPLAILCPVVRLLNVFVLSAGVFFVLFVFASAIKYGLSQGDPKALQGAKQTLTMAVLGFIIVIGVYTIITIIKNMLGLSDSVLSPFDALNNNLKSLLSDMGISD